MKVIQKIEWEGHESDSSHTGVRLAKTDNGDYAVHWINEDGSTVCGMYARPGLREEAAREYCRRVAEALKLREYAPKKCANCSNDCVGC